MGVTNVILRDHLTFSGCNHCGIWRGRANKGRHYNLRVGKGHDFLSKRVGGGGYHFCQPGRKKICIFWAFLGTLGTQKGQKCSKNAQTSV